MTRDSCLQLGFVCFLFLMLFSCNSEHEKIEGESDSTIPVSTWSAGLEQYADSWPRDFDIGKPATAELIKKWDIDVRPDGVGLPKEGLGRVSHGDAIYQLKCASCHGKNGNDGAYDKLVTDSTGSNTIGNYWPYATTIFDYVRRAMPFNQPGSLTDQEVYDITAYLLYLNNIIDAEQTIDHNNLAKIEMPALKRYVKDDRKGGNEIR